MMYVIHYLSKDGLKKKISDPLEPSTFRRISKHLYRDEVKLQKVELFLTSNTKIQLHPFSLENVNSI